MTANRGGDNDPAVLAAIVWQLLDAAFPRSTADAWATGWLGRPEPHLVLNDAIAFDDHGIDLEQALQWHQAGFAAYEATPLADEGWSPSEAETVRDLAEDQETFYDWIATGLPPERVIGYLRAHVGIGESHVFEALGDNVDITLAGLAALL